MTNRINRSNRNEEKREGEEMTEVDTSESHTFIMPKTYVIDWDKVNNLEEVILILKQLDIAYHRLDNNMSEEFKQLLMDGLLKEQP